ncbi:Rha family transcriptional regulator [Bacillus sp. OTU530]|uniref:Rha family transcriptional regulator n=1 Tax=Bacillus sp. OTU530 TaxID=3043862 RepID=UPI00313BB0DF
MDKDLVFVSNGEAVTDSLTVAEVFNKRHADVMRDIEVQIAKLEEVGEEQWGLRNFAHTQYQHKQNKQMYPKYNLTEDAFTIVAMAYTTPEAMKMKVKFLQEFRRMKEELQKRTMSPLQMIHTMTSEMMKHEERLNLLETKVEEQITIDHGEQRRVQKAIASRVYEEVSDKIRRSELFAELYREIRDRFGVASYRDLKRKDLQLAIRYIEGWIPRREVTA